MILKHSIIYLTHLSTVQLTAKYKKIFPAVYMEAQNLKSINYNGVISETKFRKGEKRTNKLK